MINCSIADMEFLPKPAEILQDGIQEVDDRVSKLNEDKKPIEFKTEKTSLKLELETIEKRSNKIREKYQAKINDAENGTAAESEQLYAEAAIKRKEFAAIRDDYKRTYVKYLLATIIVSEHTFFKHKQYENLEAKESLDDTELKQNIKQAYRREIKIVPDPGSFNLTPPTESIPRGQIEAVVGEKHPSETPIIVQISNTIADISQSLESDGDDISEANQHATSFRLTALRDVLESFDHRSYQPDSSLFSYLQEE